MKKEVEDKKVLKILFAQLQYAPLYQSSLIKKEIKRIFLRDTEANGAFISGLKRKYKITSDIIQ